MNNDNIFGRVMALALIVGAVYGANAISRGKFGCGDGPGRCCTMTLPEIPASGDAKAQPAKFDADNGASEDEAKIEAKAPVAPPK
jgi:hypothetical protein